MFYREDKHGQILQEGINEAGAISSWIAAGTSYSNHGVPMIPFYIYYSMFGFQRVGDLAWAAGDSRARGFLLGGTAGRTTLNGEGLQHEDGHCTCSASTIPNCVSYDPTYGYELAVIIQDGLRRMLAEQEDVFYYLTLMNENYQHPAMPEGAEEGILRGMYLLRERARRRPRVQLLGSGTILREVLAGADLLARRLRRRAPTSGASPSFTELRRDGHGGRALEPAAPGARSRGAPYVSDVARRARRARWSRRPTTCARSPTRSARGCRAPYRVLGTDGFGRSDYRETLRALLRGRPPPRRAGGADGAGRRRARSSRERVAEGDRALRDRRRAAGAVARCEGGDGGDRAGPGPGHRGLRRRPGDRDPGLGRATRSRPRTRSSRSSPTRRRWTCPSPVGGHGRASSRSRSATRSPRARRC